MKKLLLCATGLLLALAAGAGEPAGVKNRISAVTVYLDHALVTRSSTVRAPKGKREFVFTGLPAELADGSIRVKVQGAALRGVRVERVFLERTEKIEVRRLQDDIQKLQDEEKAVRDELGLLSAEVAFVNSLRYSTPQKLNRKLGEGELKLPDINTAGKLLDFITSRLSATAKKKRDLIIKLRELLPKISAKQRELGEKRADGRLVQKKVTVTLEAQAAADASVELCYLLPGAMWFPSYDVRADVEKGEMELTYYGVIQQATGEVWTGAELTLSASRPARRSTKPKLVPWVLGGARTAAAQVQRQLNLTQKLQIGRQYDGRGKSMKKFHGNLLRNVYQVERVLRTVAARSTSVAFPVPTRETVLTDGKPHRVTLAVEKLKLRPEYSAVPELSLATYVIGKAVNASKLPLLPGDASVYLGGDLIGTSQVAFVAPSEEAEFYLGVDESVKVTRKLNTRQSSIRSFGKRQRVTVAYSITVENFKKRPVTLAVAEALPVSQVSGIKVRVAKFAVQPAKSDQGITRWDLSVPAGGKRVIDISYTIDAPLAMISGWGSSGDVMTPNANAPAGLERASRWVQELKKK